MHRLHQDDLIGHVLAQGPWELLSLPAIAEQDETHVVDTPLGQVCFRRREGELLHPARVPMEVIDRMRKDLGPYNFAGQFQQRPAPADGGLVKAEWFRRYSRDDLPKFGQIVNRRGVPTPIGAAMY